MSEPFETIAITTHKVVKDQPSPPLIYTFEGDTVDEQPAYLTDRWMVADKDYLEVKSIAGLTGDRGLELSLSSTARYFASFDDIDESEDVSIRARVRSTSTDGIRWMFVFRGQADSGINLQHTGVSFRLQNLTAVDPVAESTVASHSHTLDTSVYYSIRARLIGTTFQAKIWDADTEPEPGWQIDESDLSIPTAAGWVGFGARSGSGVEILDYITIGLGEDDAPELP